MLANLSLVDFAFLIKVLVVLLVGQVRVELVLSEGDLRFCGQGVVHVAAVITGSVHFQKTIFHFSTLQPDWNS